MSPVPVLPAAVVFATAPHHIARRCALPPPTALKVTVQATGHGAIPVGADALLIDTSAMTDVAVDPLNRTARVAAGQRWQHVLDAACSARAGRAVRFLAHRRGGRLP
jgi:FAD/FMN-containing dehydrogenase